jgi:hypothetical protein
LSGFSFLGYGDGYGGILGHVLPLKKSLANQLEMLRHLPIHLLEQLLTLGILVISQIHQQVLQFTLMQQTVHIQLF